MRNFGAKAWIYSITTGIAGDNRVSFTTGQVGTSVIYSETAERTAADIVDEFELVRLDEYFDWSRQLRAEHLA